MASTSTAVRAPAPAIKRPNARPLPRKPVPQVRATPYLCHGSHFFSD
jgi:hypothetical protein